MTVLVRDNFSGSGTLVPRVPDTISSGGYENDAWHQGGDAATETLIAGGSLQTTINDVWGAFVPVGGALSDGYIESHIFGTTNANEHFLGLRRNPSNGAGVFCSFTPNASFLTVDLQRNGTPVMTGIKFIDYFDVNPASFTARLEVEGQQIRVFIDGVQVLNPTLNSVMLGGGGFLSVISTGGVACAYEYVEIGDLAPPPVVIVTEINGPQFRVANFTLPINPFGIGRPKKV